MPVTIRTLLAQKSNEIRLLEAHDNVSTELIRGTVNDSGKGFDGAWISGLTQTTYLGIPDTEMISPLKRATMLTFNGDGVRKGARPLCAAFDADSGGDLVDIPALVSVLALHGVSMVIIEDKALSAPGQKVNSLLATSDAQGQADPHAFAEVLRTFREAASGTDLMVTARIESFTSRVVRQDAAEERQSVANALQDALTRAAIYTAAGAHAIMIHSKSKQPDEVLAFLEGFRARDTSTPLVVVPTAYASTPRAVLRDAGADIFIYANHLMRAKIQAVGRVSDSLLAAKEGLFAQDDSEDLRVAAAARNFGCLLRKLTERDNAGVEEEEAAMLYRRIMSKLAAETMGAVVKRLAHGELSGCEADDLIIPVKDLLTINARQVSQIS
ncbi:phosphoenolpyruvate phosphomutase-domain-containing protein [Pyrenochaeta sp. MPI-SDFR-AT-0127]|nr:phosphoenolpyruvate phosphomutase-domain-containing protein [Pyrenochaeta sp. MPI-SDFR-AT-0127]